jgi:phosphate transport system ATP-binding protein
MNDSLFKVTDLDLWYSDHQALNKINMEIQKNTINAFIGPSGCGKSTFLRVLDRMNDLIDSVTIKGEVLFEGKNIYTDMDILELRRRVGMVFQKPNPFPMTIFDNVAYGPKLYKKYKKSELFDKVESALKQAALWDEVKDRLNTSALGLSGGQQQRLCLARTLAVNPDVVLMDEPTSALDPISTAKIEELMIELKKDYTIIVVTHNMQQASRVSDITSFFLIDDKRRGYLVESGETSEIFLNPKDKRTEDYISGKFG